MKRWIWIAIVSISLVGCGDTEGKTGKTGTSPNNVNNANNVSTNNENNTATNNANNLNNIIVVNNQNNANNANNMECADGEILVSIGDETLCALTCELDADCRDGDCTSGVCVPGGGGGTCTTRAECSADAECVEGECLDHKTCFTAQSTYDEFGDVCFGRWESCSDEKVYNLNCEFGVCVCLVNEVEVAQFVDDEVCFGGVSIHRVANAECGWLVPQTD